MWQAEVRVDLDAIRHNVSVLRAGTKAEVPAEGSRVPATVHALPFIKPS